MAAGGLDTAAAAAQDGKLRPARAPDVQSCSVTPAAEQRQLWVGGSSAGLTKTGSAVRGKASPLHASQSFAFIQAGC